MANVYKTISQADYNSRTVRALSTDDKALVRGVISNFITLFKAQHS
jgi:hypothetical protein